MSLFYIIVFNLLYYGKMQSLEPSTTNQPDEKQEKNALKHDFRQCLSLVSEFSSMSCDSKLGMLTNYNNLRNNVAKGRYEKHPTVANMYRSKWLSEAEKYAQHVTNDCYFSRIDYVMLSNSSSSDSNETFDCEFIFKNRLFNAWTYKEIIDYLIYVPFYENWFDDFDSDGLFRRIRLGYIGCSISLEELGGDVHRGYIGCGFCNWNKTEKAMYNQPPCSGCTIANFSAAFYVAMQCDIYYRGLCATVMPLSKSKDDPNEMSLERETNCSGHVYLPEFRSPPLQEIDSEKVSYLFLKTSYVLPILTVILLIYYMNVIKSQPYHYTVIYKNVKT